MFFGIIEHCKNKDLLIDFFLCLPWCCSWQLPIIYLLWVLGGASHTFATAVHYVNSHNLSPHFRSPTLHTNNEKYNRSNGHTLFKLILDISIAFS